MDYQYDYNLNYNNLTINPNAKPNNVISPTSLNISNVNGSSLNGNSNIATLSNNNNNTNNKDYYRDDNYGKNLGTIPYSKGNLIIFYS